MDFRASLPPSPSPSYLTSLLFSFSLVFFPPPSSSAPSFPPLLSSSFLSLLPSLSSPSQPTPEEVPRSSPEHPLCLFFLPPHFRRATPAYAVCVRFLCSFASRAVHFSRSLSFVVYLLSLFLAPSPLLLFVSFPLLLPLLPLPLSGVQSTRFFFYIFTSYFLLSSLFPHPLFSPLPFSFSLRQSFPPTTLPRCCSRVYTGLPFFAGKRTPILRLCGRSAHDATARPAMMRGARM